MKTIRRGFTLIEVLIAVLVLSVALGASLQAIGNYTGFQAALKERYYSHLIAWDVLMECYILLRTEPEAECDGGGTVYLKEQYWDWDGVDQEGYYLKVFSDESEIRIPLKLRTVKVYPPEDNSDAAGELMTILPLDGP